MYFEHLVEINDPADPLAETLGLEQVWTGLMYRVHEPTVFLPGLDRCVVREESPNRVSRELHFGNARILDNVTFRHQEWVCFESAATPEHAGGRLKISLEQPDGERLFLRFTYETTLSEGMEEEEGVQVSEFVKSAYRASDLDTVRVIRMIATTGRPQ